MSASPHNAKRLPRALRPRFGHREARVHDERGEWAGSAGWRKLGATAKPPADGRFRIGSSTKPFVAILVLQLVDDGEIKLDGPVADCLPEFKLDRRITALMLLRHTSGLYNYTSWSYSNTGYTLARLLIEKVTGHSITYGDTAPDLAKARDNLLKQVFCGGPADKGKPAR